MERAKKATADGTATFTEDAALYGEGGALKKDVDFRIEEEEYMPGGEKHCHADDVTSGELYKFDIRQWVVVTSFGWNEGVLPQGAQPGDVRAWFYEDSYLRFAGSPYKVLTEEDENKVNVDANPASDAQDGEAGAGSEAATGDKSPQRYGLRNKQKPGQIQTGTFGHVPLDSPTAAAASGAATISPLNA